MMRWMVVAITLLLPNIAAAVPCTLSATVMNFGNYSGAALVTGITTITVNCPNGLAYSVGTNSGSHQGSGDYNWNMLGNTSVLLHYSMYRNAGYTSLWGNIPGFDTVDGTGNGAAQTITIYSTVPAGQYVAPGTYADTDTISLFSTDATVTTTLTVNTTVMSTCTISANPLAFGVYRGLVVYSATTLSVTCTNTTTYNIGADNGLHAQFIGVWAKYMIGPSGSRLRYHIYTDCTRSTEWGTTLGTNEVAGTGNGAGQSIPVCGTIGAGSYGSVPGSYSDTVTITITY